MAETLAPSVRRAKQPMLWAILVLTGLCAALPIAVISALIFSGDHRRGLAVAGAVTVLILEVSWRTIGLPRPTAVHRQVPRSWGHEHGPWWGAARYGPRLAVGPATILTSWSWWGMWLLGALAGWRWAVSASAVFVVVRATAIVGAGAGITEGRAMAARMQGFRALEDRAANACLVLMALGTTALGAVALVS